MCIYIYIYYMYVYDFQAYMIYKPFMNWYGDDVNPPKPTPRSERIGTTSFPDTAATQRDGRRQSHTPGRGGAEAMTGSWSLTSNNTV